MVVTEAEDDTVGDRPQMLMQTNLSARVADEGAVAIVVASADVGVSVANIAVDTVAVREADTMVAKEEMFMQGGLVLLFTRQYLVSRTDISSRAREARILIHPHLAIASVAEDAVNEAGIADGARKMEGEDEAVVDAVSSS
jgi:hypothetical protein